MPAINQSKLPSLDISIIICTYNRGQIFADTLESYATLEHPPGTDIELLIIDNNSTDDTPEISSQFMQQHPEVRYVFEPEPGLSHARKRGIKESRGDIIAYVDDDIFFEKQWITALHTTFSSHQDASCVGGRVVPKFECDRPDWLSDDLLWIYAATRYGDEEKLISPPDIPMGGNVAYRRSIFNKVGNFHTSLGRVGKNLLSCEENALFSLIEQAGLKVFYSPNMTIKHRIQATRTSRQWVFNRYYWQGISEIVQIQTSPQRLSRRVLITKAFHEANQLFKQLMQLKGSDWSPRHIYWRYKKIPVNTRVWFEYRAGTIKQCISEAFTITGR